jgi:SAM-dependent methyltransferase
LDRSRVCFAIGCSIEGTSVTNLYDRVRYPSQPFANTHPLATGVFAAVYGRCFTPFRRSRVLEIGCGEGVNLINMALGAPGAQFVGVDLAEQSIARARATSQGCCCANADFVVLDLAEIDASFGHFDYIIAHGVYSWTPAPVRTALMRVAGERLSTDGIALISYNALPGSRFRQAINDMLLFVTERVVDPAAKLELAHTFLAEQAEIWSETEADEIAMKSEVRRILKKRVPEALFHDELGQDYAPQLLSATAAMAEQFGLEYLCDAQASLSKEALFPSDAYAATRDRAGGDWVRFEQLADFRTLRRFRYSLFCRGSADRRLEGTRLRGLWACCELTALEADPGAPDGAAFEAGPRVKIKTRDPKLASFLAELAAAFPLAVSLDAASENPVLAEYVFLLFVNQVIQLATGPWPLVAVAGDRPNVNPLARLQAANGEAALATLRHQVIQIDEASVRALVPLMDGTRTREEVALDIARREEISAEIALTRLNGILAKLAKAGVMAG